MCLSDPRRAPLLHQLGKCLTLAPSHHQSPHTHTRTESGLYLVTMSRTISTKPTPIIELPETRKQKGRSTWKQLRRADDCPPNAFIRLYLHRGDAAGPPRVSVHIETLMIVHWNLCGLAARVDTDRSAGLRREFYFQKDLPYMVCIVYPMNPQRRKKTGAEGETESKALSSASAASSSTSAAGGRKRGGKAGRRRRGGEFLWERGDCASAGSGVMSSLL